MQCNSSPFSQIGRVVPARPGERARHAEDGGGGQDRGRLRGPHAAREGPHAEAQRGADRGTVQASLAICCITSPSGKFRGRLYAHLTVGFRASNAGGLKEQQFNNIT